MWLYQGSSFSEENIKNYKCFVYCITNLHTGKKYIGKKKFETFRRKKYKNRKNKKKVVKQSDWQTYFGSNKELNLDVQNLGTDKFKREILLLCNSTGEASYYESKYQFENDVLLKPDEYYNTWIMCRVHRQHLIKEKK